MDQNTLKLNYIKTAISAMEKLKGLEITDRDEDLTIEQLIQMLKVACSGYDGTYKKESK